MRARHLNSAVVLSAAASLFAASLLCADPALAKSSLGIGGGELAPTPSNGLMGVIFVQLTTWQREFFTLLRHAIVSLRHDGSALPYLVGLSFVYGIFHAAGPGHGKAVISSYIVANRLQLKRGILLSFASSVVQALSAIGVVGTGWFVLRGTSISMTNAADWVEIASFALVAVFGAWLLTRKLVALARGRFASLATLFRGRGAAPSLFDGLPAYESAAPGLTFAGSPSGSLAWDARLKGASAGAAPRSAAFVPSASKAMTAGVCRDDADDCGCGREHIPDPARLAGTMTLGSAASAVFSIGLRPCSGAVIVLTFALVNGLYLGGLLSVFAMSLGTAITVSSIAAFAVFARESALKLGGNGRAGRVLITVMEIGGAAFMLVMGLVLLAAGIAAL